MIPYFKNANKKRGRDAMFKCSICGKFVLYDRRTVNTHQYTDSIFDGSQEQWYPEEEIEFIHKKCEKKK